jgi:hypothetical protein
MKRLFSAYPAGLAGAALLLFRCSLALFLATSASGILSLNHWPALLLDVCAIALGFGIATRTLAGVVAAGAAIALLLGACATPALLLPQAINAIALALIGPGAFSIDARLFGRATIHLPR